MKLAVFDIDGTITTEAKDTWFILSREGTRSKSEFDRAVQIWRGQKIEDPYGASKRMMEKAIELMQDGTASLSLSSKAKSLAINLYEEGHIRSKAIEQINESIDSGYQVVFSTTNYTAAAKGFLQALVELRLLSEDKSKTIAVTGTEVDWSSRSLIHFNMSQGKIAGIANALGVSKKNVIANIHIAFGDDPTGNDKMILQYAQQAYLVSTNKNKEYRDLKIKRIEW